MGKPNQCTKCLYRKSNSTLNTRSKTCSGASQFLTKSGILQLKKNLTKNNYYTENGIVKRDLSVETDKCKLRCYYKRKFGRCKYSVNTNEVKTINEPICDLHSCGDSNLEANNEKRINIDVTSLVVENLKDLLNEWIKKYLLNDTDTKQKIETVLDSILHNLELQRNSSSCTYTLSVKVDENKSLSPNPLKNKPLNIVAKGKQSCQTVPVTGKHVKLISTLSIPRHVTKHVALTNSKYKKHAARNIRYKNVFLKVSHSSTFLLNSSSFNLLSISTKSFTRRCATYHDKDVNTSGRKPEIVLLPKSSYNESMADAIYNKENFNNFDIENKIFPNVLEIEPVESLVKSIYADDPANVTSTDINIYKTKHDNYTMTDTESAFKNVTPVQCPKLNWEKVKDTTDSNIIIAENKYESDIKFKPQPHRHKIIKTMSKKKHIRPIKRHSKKHICSTNLHRKTNTAHKENNLFKDIESIVKHFTHYTESKNITFDVRINVFPGIENKRHDEANNAKSKHNTPLNGDITAAYNVVSTQILSKSKSFDAKKCIIPQESHPKLISILDGAVSQSRYVINNSKSDEITSKKSKVSNVKMEPHNISTGLEIAKDISELRVIIKDLAITTENFVKEHLENLKYYQRNDIDSIRKESKVESSEKIRSKGDSKSEEKSTLSKPVQIPNDKSSLISGLKLKKDPKKKDTEVFNSKLCKKSISYNIIESESILKVTDMTSTAEEISNDILIDEALNCSLPKSKSEFEITIGQSKRKLLAYYCDELIKSRQFMQSRNNRCNCSSNNACKYARYVHTDKDSCKLINEKKCHEDMKITCDGPQRVPFDDEDCELGGPGYSCSSIYVDVEDRKKFTVRSRSGMGFWEGLMFCVLLWIPVVVICWLIYIYVIRDMIQPADTAIEGKVASSQRSSNSTLFHVTLTDLGF